MGKLGLLKGAQVAAVAEENTEQTHYNESQTLSKIELECPKCGPTMFAGTEYATIQMEM